jgi:hypothetical protein
MRFGRMNFKNVTKLALCVPHYKQAVRDDVVPTPHATMPLSVFTYMLSHIQTPVVYRVYFSRSFVLIHDLLRP